MTYSTTFAAYQECTDFNAEHFQAFLSENNITSEKMNTCLNPTYKFTSKDYNTLVSLLCNQFAYEVEDIDQDDIEMCTIKEVY